MSDVRALTNANLAKAAAMTPSPETTAPAEQQATHADQHAELLKTLDLMGNRVDPPSKFAADCAATIRQLQRDLDAAKAENAALYKACADSESLRQQAEQRVAAFERALAIFLAKGGPLNALLAAAVVTCNLAMLDKISDVDKAVSMLLTSLSPPAQQKMD